MSRTAAERAAIHRDGPTCLRCGRVLHNFPSSVHHRLPRSAGTKDQVDRVENLVVVCGTGSSPHCHFDIHNNPTESYLAGWLVRRGDDPATVPLVNLDGRQFFLTDAGDLVALLTSLTS